MSSYSKLGLKDKLLLSKMNALERLIIATGRWNKDSDFGIIALSGDPFDRLVANHAMEYYEKLSDEAKAVVGE